MHQDTSPRPLPGVTLWDPALGSLWAAWANREKSHTQLSSSFSQGICARLDPSGHQCGILEDHQELGMLQPGGVDTDDSKHVPQCIMESWNGFGSKGAEGGFGMIYSVSALLHLSLLNFTPE